MFDQSSTLREFLDAAAAKQPAPGGGSVTALVGALAASMGEMVVNYSVGKKDLQAYIDELRPALAEYNRARQLLLQLMAEDQSAYSALTAAQASDTVADRAAQIDTLLMVSIRGPQAMAATAVAILELCDRIVNFVNPWLLSDLAVCADLSMATVRCSMYNVRVNLPGVTDPAERQRIEAATFEMLSRAGSLIQQVSPRIWARQEQAT